jgi:hypothetical protein
VSQNKRAAALFIIISLPFTGLEVFRLAGKSITLPFVSVVPGIISLLPFSGPGLTKHTRIFTGFLLCFILWGILSCQARFFYDSTGFAGMKNLTQTGYLIFAAAAFLTFYGLIKKSGSQGWRFFARAFVITAAVHAFYALFQAVYFHLTGSVIDLFRNANIYSHFRPSSAIHSWTGIFRVSGTFPEPVMMSGFTLFAFFLISPLVFKNPFARFTLSALLLFAGFLTSSRTFFAVFIILFILKHLLIYLLKQMPIQAGTIVFVSLFALGLIFLPGIYLSRPDTCAGLSQIINAAPFINQARAGRLSRIFSDGSVTSRFSEMTEVLKGLKAHPFMGTGLGSYGTFKSRYSHEKGPYSNDFIPCANSWLLVIILETGLIGFLLFSFSFLSLFYFLILILFSEFSGPAYNRVNASALINAACLVPGIYLYWIGYGGLNFTFIWLACAIICSIGDDFICKNTFFYSKVLVL